MLSPIITIDGPSGVGKGTVALLLAQKLKWPFLDSGALYRLVALAAMNQNINSDDELALAAVAKHLEVSFTADEPSKGAKVFLSGQEVSQSIRTEQVATMASQVAVLPKVREALLARQKAFSTEKGLIADGRDMGTVVFPEATVKIFLTASSEERAKRRVKQLLAKGDDVKMPQIQQEIEQRDARDQNRTHSPLVPADDAKVLDTSCLTIEQVMDEVSKIVQNCGVK